MAYCGPRGIPLSRFLSWPVTDQDAALAWSSHEGRRCRCGHHPDEPGDVHAHMEQCPGCLRLEQLTSSTQAKDAGRGARAVLVAGAARACPRCSPPRE